MKTVKARGLAVSIILSAVGAACILSTSACSSTAKVENQGTSVGQQLQDLEEARDKGLITEQEYNRQRRRILDGK